MLPWLDSWDLFVLDKLYARFYVQQKVLGMPSELGYKSQMAT